MGTKRQKAAETLVAYRASELPLPLLGSLPTELHDRLFYVARDGSKAIQALFEAVKEPALKSAPRGLKLAATIAGALMQNARLAELVYPEQRQAGGSRRGGSYESGFHAAPAEEVEAYLRARGLDTVKVGPLLDELLIVRVEPTPTRQLFIESFEINCGFSYELAPISPGLYAFDRADRANEHFVIQTRDRKTKVALRAAEVPRGVVTVRLARA